MALVTTKQMLINAQKDNYAVGAFNVENMEMVMAVVEAAEELNTINCKICRCRILFSKCKSSS